MTARPADEKNRPANSSGTSNRIPAEWRAVEPTGSWFRFESHGDELVGVWLGFQVGRFERPDGAVKTSSGVLRFGLNFGLERQLKRIPEGCRVGVRYVGDEVSKSGRSYKRFLVLVPPGTERLPVAADPDPADSGQVPF
jgi:hypothetical protein